MGNKIDLKGQVFGRLTVIKAKPSTASGHATWLCKCSCGNSVIVRSSSLIPGDTRSCGCLWKERTIKKRTCSISTKNFYTLWYNIKTRCLNDKSKDFKNYGGRGIKICKEWLKFLNFEADMYASYLAHKATHKGTTIERKDNNGDYCLKNCCWATWKEQAKNRRKHSYNN